MSGAVVGIVLGCLFGAGAVVAVGLGKAARLADEIDALRDFNAHADEAIALQDPPVPLAWPLGVVPLRVDADVFRAHHDRRGGAR